MTVPADVQHRLVARRLRGEGRLARALAAVVFAGGLVLGCVATDRAATTTSEIPAVPPNLAPLTALDAEIDHVGLPEGYRARFVPFFENERAATRDVHVAYINPAGAVAREDRPFPYGTVIVLETYPALPDAAGAIARGGDGRFRRGDLATIFVMRKERGLGAKYGPDRTGEWEYADYKPDGNYDLAPQLTQTCAQCHLALSNAQQDWLISANRFFAQRRQRGEDAAAVSPPELTGTSYLPGLIPVALAVGAPLLGLTIFAMRSLRWRP